MLQRRSVAPILFLILAGTLAGTLAACSTSTPAEDEFQGALARWRRTGLVSYSFKSTISCFCSREYTTPKTVTVRGRVVVSVVDRETGVPSPVEYRQSIDSVFAMVRQELIARPSRLEVEYDPALGYPRRLKYGTPENDAGGYIYLDSVEVAP